MFCYRCYSKWKKILLILSHCYEHIHVKIFSTSILLLEPCLKVSMFSIFLVFIAILIEEQIMQHAKPILILSIIQQYLSPCILKGQNNSMSTKPLSITRLYQYLNIASTPALFWNNARPTSCTLHIDGLVKDCGNSGAFTVELQQSCTKSSIYNLAGIQIPC